MVQSRRIARGFSGRIPTSERAAPTHGRRCLAAGLLLLALAGVAVAGCGFRPMYGKPAESAEPTQAAVTQDLSAIRVGLIPNRSGQLLRNELTLLLDPSSTSADRRYTLNIQLSEREDRLALERTGFATRANVEMTATFTLIDDASGAPALAGSSRAISGYNLLDNDFSTLVARGDALNRAVDQLALEIRNRLAAHFTRQAQATAAGGS